MSKDLRAMVLAAGIGSRLAPLSDNIPKPLIRIGGRTIIEHILLLLKQHGINNVISNTYHLADQIHKEFERIEQEHGMNIEYRKEKELSGVAGGIRICKDFLEKGTAVILMGDALTDVDLTSLYKKHKKAVEENNCIVTIAQMQVEDTSQFGVIVTESLLAESDSRTAQRVVSFQEKPKKEAALSNWANTGIYFFEPKVYDYIPSIEEAPKYDVAGDLFPKLLEAGEYMQAISVQEDMYWADLGTPKQYLQSVKDIAEGRVKLDLKVGISKTARIDTSTRIEGNNEIGENTKIGANCRIKNCVIWDSVIIEDEADLENCIIGSNTLIKKRSKLKDKILVAECVSS